MNPQTQQILRIAAALALVGLVTLLAQHFWRENGLRSLQAVNEPRAQLVANAVKAEIGRQDHLPVVLSLDRDVQQALADPDNEASRRKLNEKIRDINREADTRALYIISRSGIVFASDDFDTPDTLLGRDLSDRPYFREAMTNQRSTFLGVEPASDRVRYYVAHAIGSAPVLGVAVVRIEFDHLESAWLEAGERVLVTDQRGTVFLSSDPDFKYRKLNAIGADDDDVAGRYPENSADAIDLKIVEQRGSGQIVDVRLRDDSHSYLYQSLSLPAYGWTVHRLSDLSIVDEDQRDGAIIGATLSILAACAFFYLRHRQLALDDARKASARLSSEVADRTLALREANAALQIEVDERRRTEATLRDTQNSLVQAGKLAALGQMSAAIAHEINQPLAAIRTFIASTKIYSARGDATQVTTNLDLINGLAERMAKITTHLKTFARKSDSGKTETVDVERAIHGAMTLIENQIRLAGISFKMDVGSHIFIKGYAVQLEQVIVNLLQNAMHAVSETRQPNIHLSVTATDDNVRISVQDNGVGIPKAQIDKIFDPFFTTKAIGKGLGLGLSISYGIVRDFDGEIRAVSLPDGGVEMVVELPRHHPESALLHA